MLYEDAYEVTTTQVLNASDLAPIGTLRAPGETLLNDLVLLSANTGIAIAGNQLFRVSAGELIPFALNGDFEARDLQMDIRSRRILVKGAGDFIVLDFSGNILFRYAEQTPVANQQRWVSAKLAIDGSVGILREGDSSARVLTRQSNYRESRLTPLERQDWNRVACFTPNSAALWVDDKPLLVKF